MTDLGLLLEHEKTSQVFKRFVSNLSVEQVNLADLTRLLDQRSFAGLLLVLAILCFIPGVSVFAGAALVLPGWQMLIAKKTPILPEAVNRLNVPSRRLKKGFSWILPRLTRLESWVKPRWLLFSTPLAQCVIGAVVLMLAVIVAIPFPLSNLLPAIALLLLATGMLEKDGILISAGLTVSVLAISVSWVVVETLYFWFERFFLL